MFPSKQDPIRRLVKYTVFGAGLSWMHSEVTKYRRFSPLPSMRGMNVRMPNLPPFLPPLMEEDHQWNVMNEEEGSSRSKEATTKKEVQQKSKKNTNTEEEESSKENTNNNHHHPHYLWDPFQSFGTISSAYRSWLEGYELRNKQSYQQRRIRTEEQLLELKKKESMNSTTNNNGDVGYALVTGASSGIVSFFFILLDLFMHILDI